MAATEKPVVKLLRVGLKFSGTLSFILSVLGLLGLFALPLFERKVKFDEKTLMLGSARSNILKCVHACMLAHVPDRQFP
jgi:hypothetical protein